MIQGAGRVKYSRIRPCFCRSKYVMKTMTMDWGKERRRTRRRSHPVELKSFRPMDEGYQRIRECKLIAVFPKFWSSLTPEQEALNGFNLPAADMTNWRRMGSTLITIFDWIDYVFVTYLYYQSNYFFYKSILLF